MFIIALISILSFNYQKSNNKEVKLKCVYMAYACGDCYPQYKVEAVLYPDNISKKVMGKEIYVEFKDREMEDKLTQEVHQCAICYYYIFSGELKYSIFKKAYTLEIDEFDITLKFNDCCE